MKPLIAFMLAASLAFAVATPSALAHARVSVINHFECLIVPQDSGLPILLFSNKVTHEVDTASGNSILQCHFNVPEGYVPSRTLHHQGFLCGTFLGETTISRSVTTRGGKILLICQVKNR